jgi:hypothetical protein
MPTAFDAKIAVGSILPTGINKVENGIESRLSRLRQYSVRDPKRARRLYAQEHPRAVMFWRSVGSSQMRSSSVTSTSWRKRRGGPLQVPPHAAGGKSDFLACSTPSRRRAIGVSRQSSRGHRVSTVLRIDHGQVAEVTVSQKARSRSTAVAAVDCGHVVSQGIVEAQIRAA